jgi:protein-S-isoprenylcysteine O-methyltransferase Ste14
VQGVRNGPSVKRPYVADVVAAGFALGVFISGSVFHVNGPRWLTALGVAAIATAVPFIVLPFLHLRRHGMSGKGGPFHETTHIVRIGLYSIVRHPQYAGYTLLVLGLAFINPHIATLILAAAAAVLFHTQAVLEERFCKELFGREYDEYVQVVPRFNVPLGVLRAIARSLTERT